MREVCERRQLVEIVELVEVVEIVELVEVVALFALIGKFFVFDWEANEGLWWRRELIGTYAPSLERQPDGKFMITGVPEAGQRIRR